MDELVKMASDRLGLEKDVVKKAVGALLKFIQESGSVDLSPVLNGVDGAEALLRDPEAKAAVAEAPPASGGGGSGGLFQLVFNLLKLFGIIAMLRQLVAGFLGEETAVKLIDTVEDGAQLSAVLGKLGIDREKGMKMVRMTVDFLKDKLDAETVDKIVEQVPALKFLLREEKKQE